MEINDFDKLVKEQMSKMEVAPSTGIKKAIAFKVFFNNLLLFHKVKLVALLLLMSGGVYIGVNYTGNESALASEENTAESEMVDSENSLVVNEDLIDNSIKEENSTSNKNNQENASSQSSVLDNNVLNEEIQTNTSSNVSSDNSSNGGTKTIASNGNKTNSSVLEESTSGDSNVEAKQITVNNSNNNAFNNVVQNDDEVSGVSEDAIDNVEKKYTLEDEYIENENIQKFDIIDPKIIETEITLDNSLPSAIVVEPMDDYANNTKKRGFTIDGYYSMLNKVDVDNKLDADLSTYHWDFYKEHGYVKTDSRGGINVNYNWNNFKIGSGVQLSTLRDYKSVYKYFYLPGSYNGNFTMPTVSSAIVYGEDTTIVFFADPSNKELHKEIENEYNRYSYIKVPLTLGYEFDLKYFSLELNAGIEYGHLIKAKGVEVKYGNVINDPVQVYFYSDKYMDMMSRKSTNLNKHQFSIMANATLRVRLTPSFDLYSSVNYTQSKTGIYSDKYFLQKTYNNYGAKIGVTYYLNKRLKLKETTSSSF